MNDTDQLATPAEACREYARNVGAERPDRPWILTDYDTWQPNPHFVGPLCLKLVDPESRDEEFSDLHAECHLHDRCLHAYGESALGPIQRRVAEISDDEIPF